MSVPSLTCGPTTCAGSHSVISSPELRDGRTLCASQGGLTTDPSGPEVAPVNLSAQLAREPVSPTSATCGPSSSTLSVNADLPLLWESRLKQLLTTAGSTLFKLTWKEKITPSGQRVSLLRASARRISDKDCGGWPTAQARDWKGPQGRAYKDETLDLPAAPLRAKPWLTPTARDHKDGASDGTVPINGLLGRQVWEVSGQTSKGSPAETGKRGQLNPAFSLWLQGFPPEWESCAPLAMPSSRKSRKPLSDPISTAKSSDENDIFA